MLNRIGYLGQTRREVSDELNEIFERFDDFGDGEIVEHTFAVLVVKRSHWKAIKMSCLIGSKFLRL